MENGNEISAGRIHSPRPLTPALSPGYEGEGCAYCPLKSLHCFELKLRIQLQLKILKPHLRRASRVNLQPEDPFLRDLVVIDIRAEMPVDRGADLPADGEDLVRVPVFLVDELAAIKLLAFFREQ